MKRHAGKKGVNPQWQPFELLCRDLWHRASFVALLLLFFDCPEDRFQDVLRTSGASHTTASGSPCKMNRSAWGAAKSKWTKLSSVALPLHAQG
jgi:hypothetical protein